MSSGDPAYWAGRAPLLFPIVGRLNADVLRLCDGQYTMQKHGFARRSEFAPVDTSDAQALFRLVDNAETRDQYPFAFELDVHFRLEGSTLHNTVTVRNTDRCDLPFSFGFHPAFAWPLPYGRARAEHEIRFERAEEGPLCRITPYGTIAERPAATPVDGDTLKLADELFVDDALVWASLASRRLLYGAQGAPMLDIAFPDTPALGIWTKPGAGIHLYRALVGHCRPRWL